MSATINVNNGKQIEVPGIEGVASLSTQTGKMRLAFWASQRRPDFKAGFQFEIDGDVWMVSEIQTSEKTPCVASLQLVNKD